MKNIEKLPIVIRRAIEEHEPGPQLDSLLSEWRHEIEARNSQNWIGLSAQDQAFVDFHNDYRRR